ncbi:MAG: dicarboxylate/amino acid:cation symporter [Erysipelotrichaceae bacterium]|nr:dicarboxylate/amino acid:cation symporter [Erysipelotrichaceae bacterium]
MKKSFRKSEVEEMLSFIRSNVQKHKLKNNEENRALLMSEETLVTMLEHTTGDEITIGVNYFGGNLKIRMTAKGEGFDPVADTNDDQMHAALMKSFASDIHIKSSKGTNTITITAFKSRYLLLYKLVFAALLSIALSMALRTASTPQVCQWVSTQVMTTGKTLFMNCLNMLIPPLVFFSIASAIVGFGDTSQLGRIGGKTMSLYAFTTMCATAIGFILVELIKPYKYGNLNLQAADLGQAGVKMSFTDSLINVIPNNIVASFLNADTVQIIFLAVIIGLGTAAVGTKGKAFQDFINAGNEVFLRLTNTLVGFMPLLIFCIIGEVLLGGSSGGNGMGLPIIIGIGVYVLAIVIMIIFYHLLLLILGKLRPLVFTRKYLPYMLQVIGIGSSSAAIPLNMKVCESLGIDRKVYSLSIPLGATVNMDGTTIYMSVFGLLLARLYGLPINLSVYFTLTFAILLLSAGAPPVMGSSIICLTALLRTIGLPVEEAVSMVLGVEVIAGLLRTANNAVCDMVGSLIVANQEGLLNKDKYYSTGESI